VKQSHGICKVICGRNYSTCRHSCSKICHGKTDGKKCPPCTHPCEVRCSHSKCNKPCHEPCAPCAEKKCQSSCPHAQCTMPCAAPCDWVPCTRRCTNTLSCRHQCEFPSLSNILIQHCETMYAHIYRPFSLWRDLPNIKLLSAMWI
jgi:hypothetical protein